MPRNGSGTFSLPAGYTATTGQTITAAQHNDPLEDIASDLNAARPVVAGGTGATTASAARTNLGLAIGTNVQAFDATLTSIAALGTAADRFAYTTGVDTWVEATITAAGRALLDDADAAAQRTTLGLGNIATTDLIDEDDMASDLDTRAPTQQSVKAYVDATDAKIPGVGQTWQDVSASRLSDLTVYQNTTGKPIMVNVLYAGDFNSAYFEVSADSSTWVRVYGDNGDGGPVPMTGVIVPDQWYYRSSTSGGTADPDWFELR